MKILVVFILILLPTLSYAAELSSERFFKACDNGKKSILRKDIRKVQVINQEDKHGKNCLIHALESEQVDFSLWLIRNSKIDVNHLTKNNISALWVAVDLDLKPIIKELLYKGVSTNIVAKDTHQTLLHIAAKIGNDQMMTRIIGKKKSKNLNLKDSNGDTALIKAVIFDHPQLVQKLLLKGADTSVKNNEGMTAKDYAIKNQSDHLLKILN